MLLYPTTRSEWSMLYGGDGMAGREERDMTVIGFRGPISIYTVSGQRSEEEETKKNGIFALATFINYIDYT